MSKKVVIRVDPERRQWWKETMSKLLPDLEVVLWDEDDFRKEDIAYAIVWAPPSGMLASLPNLECVLSVGAGVAHITDDPTHPRSVPIIRTVGAPLRQRMCEYVSLHVLRIHRRLHEIEKASEAGEWKQFVEPVASNILVGLMGVGNLGSAVARTLLAIGYRVRGLSRRGRAVEGLDIYPVDQFSEFLSGLNIVASILPGTPETDNIINSRSLAKLPKGAWIINAGRGSHVNDSDLLAALDSEHLSGAVLDVFRREPLPAEHPFWRHPKILITSHTASAIEPSIGGTIIAQNLRAFIAGQKSPDIVDLEQGY
jgi:glyoxylate/hydroxypyruvate reductase A